jgi:hypothetical protein
VFRTFIIAFDEVAQQLHITLRSDAIGANT